MTVLEDQRLLQEDLERLEQAITDRVTNEAKQVSLDIWFALLLILLWCVFKLRIRC